MAVIKRSRETTMKRIVDALEQLILDKGVHSIYVSTVAQQAKVSKNLIYYYFGNLNGLFSYFLRQIDLVPHFSSTEFKLIQSMSPVDGSSLWTQGLLTFIRQLRTHRAHREVIIRAHQAAKKDEKLAQALDTELTRLLVQLSSPQATDRQAPAVILLSGLLYLTIQAHYNRSVLGIDLRSEEGWHRIESAVSLLIKASA